MKAWLKNRFTDLKYFCWLAKNRHFPIPFLLYWILYPIPRLLYGVEKAPDISQKIIQRFMGGNLIIPLPIYNPYWIGLRDSSDFDTFREVCIEDHYNHSQLKPGMTVVDVGAHIGTFTLLASKKVGEKGKVIAVEPELHNFEQLKRNLELNKTENVIPANIALSDFNGKENFFITKGSGCHSFSHMPGEQIIDKIQINVKTLDTLLQELNITKLDLIKIDAEGAEFKILKGTRETLIKNPKMKMVIAAYHSSRQALEITEHLKELNFSPEILPGVFTLVVVK